MNAHDAYSAGNQGIVAQVNYLLPPPLIFKFYLRKQFTTWNKNKIFISKNISLFTC